MAGDALTALMVRWGMTRPGGRARQAPWRQGSLTAYEIGLAQALGIQSGPAGWSAKPAALQRAKSWEPAVEIAYRFQMAGWRDAREYLSSGVGDMDLWPPETRASVAWPKKLRMKGSKSDFCYYRRGRECTDSMCNRVKIFTYEEE